MFKFVDVYEDDIVLITHDHDNDSENLDTLLKTRDKIYNRPVLFPSFHTF